MNMKRVGKNSIAVGLGVLLVSAAFAFSAQGATTYKSHAEAQFLSGIGPIGDVIGQVGDAVGNKGVVACEPARTGCPEESFVTSPFDPAEQLTGPAGDGIGLKLGAVNDYAVAGKNTPGKSLAGSGAVDNSGIIRAGGSPSVPLGGATLDLTTGGLAPLASTLANVKLALGAVSATASLAPTAFTPARDYNIEGGTVTLQVPALAAINTALGGAASTVLNDPLTINATQICSLLTALGGAPLMGTPLGGLIPINVCDNLVLFNGVFSGTITGLSSATGGLTTFTQDGVTFNFTTGAITINLDAAVFAVLNKHINDLPPNTDLLATILPSLALNLPTMVANLKADLIDQIVDNVSLQATLLGTALPPLSLSALGAAGLDSALGSIFDGLGTALTSASQPLAGALTQINAGLAQLLQIIVNVPDLYTTKGLVSGDSVSTAAAGTFYSQTAVRVIVAQGQLADLRLATAQVGPNGPTTVDNQADSNADVNADANAQADAKADPAADADVASTLPNTGGSNVLPLLFMALGLMAFGTTVLVNERRRLKLM